MSRMLKKVGPFLGFTQYIRNKKHYLSINDQYMERWETPFEGNLKEKINSLSSYSLDTVISHNTVVV